MNDKTNANLAEMQRVHRIPAGILHHDIRTELFADLETRKVFALHRGKTIAFKDLPGHIKVCLFELLESDSVAKRDLGALPMSEALEQFAFCLFGALDHVADFCAKGQINASDNFQCSESCRCIFWSTKKMRLNDVVLTPQKVRILNLLRQDIPDKAIALQLGITHSTLDSHKRQLFEMANVSSTKGLLMAAAEQKIIA